MRFSGKVNDTIEFLFGKELIEEGGLPYISTNKVMPFSMINWEIFKIAKISSISQCIQINNAPFWPESKGMMDKVCADEACTAGD
jgi:hypothetical protein